MVLPLPKVGGGGSWVNGPSRGGRQPHGISPPEGGEYVDIALYGKDSRVGTYDMGCVGGITDVGFSSCAGRDILTTFLQIPTNHSGL